MKNPQLVYPSVLLILRYVKWGSRPKARYKIANKNAEIMRV